MTVEMPLILGSQEEANEIARRSRERKPTAMGLRIAAIERLFDRREITQDEYFEVVNGNPMPESLREKIEQEVLRGIPVQGS